MSSGGASEQFKIGAQVEAVDGRCGELTALIIDPVARALTHLVVTPSHHRGFGRLVPLEAVESAGDPVRLSCTVEQFLALDEGEEMQFLPVNYAGGQAYQWPHYELEQATGLGGGGMRDIAYGHRPTRESVVSDRIPAGEVEVRRGDPVHAADGFVGSVKGVVIDPKDHHVTHVLLEEGHLWGRKQVAIPIGAMTRQDQEVRVDLTKEQIAALPPVNVSSPN
jgi:sporulation protein YlmC with PRC-barrel domain